ncbi:MAG: 3,8-cyclase [Gaiellaceae bacterium]|jgi:cyclic pyranopterin phosphate synthase|nr:3,8-cyclase [Gaiellaceae bacterium]
MDALDTFGRPLRDLRISVTDRCNFRCVYCMPKEIYGRDHRFLERRELLTFEEITRVARTFVSAGVTKLRITGGEPLVRRDLERLIAQLADLDVDLTLTTNGSLLPQKAQALADAGLRRITVSLDSLDDAIFRALNDVDFSVERVLDGIDAAAAAGLPVKVNAVIKRGVNDDQVVPLAAFFRDRGHTLRFIEYMDVGNTNGWRLDDVVPAKEIVARLDDAFGVEPAEALYRGEVAQRWRYKDGKGEVGVIASVTQPFCGDCTRARLSAEGKLFTCLFAVRGHDLRALIRGGAPDEELETAVRTVWGGRADRYSDLRSAATAGLDKVEMSYIGG